MDIYFMHRMLRMELRLRRFESVFICFGISVMIPLLTRCTPQCCRGPRIHARVLEKAPYQQNICLHSEFIYTCKIDMQGKHHMQLCDGYVDNNAKVPHVTPRFRASWDKDDACTLRFGIPLKISNALRIQYKYIQIII